VHLLRSDHLAPPPACNAQPCVGPLNWLPARRAPQVHLLKKDLITAHQKVQEGQQELDNQRSHFQQQIKELLDEIQDLQFQVRGLLPATMPPSALP
jgi:hypothetical protein